MDSRSFYVVNKEGPIMANATAPYGSLTLAVTKASALAATNVVVGFVDEFNRGRMYAPFSEALAPQGGDTAAAWLPSVVSKTTVTAPDGSGQVGQYKVVLQPGVNDTVNVASVQTVTVDPNALFITATGTW